MTLRAGVRACRMLSLLVAVFVGLGMIGTARGQDVEWTRFGLTPRSLHAMAYDSVRGVTVLFGGSGSDISGETWEWNGVVWNQRKVNGPSPRYRPAMAYDSARRVMVLFGGSNVSRSTDGTSTGSDNGETWEWDGAVWTQRAVTGPSPRVGHAMVYDSARGVTVFFGGIVGGSYNAETWEWNGAVWNRRLVNGPSARSGHVMAYDTQRGVTVLFGGGIGNAAVYRDTWEWNGSAWSLRASTGPTRRFRPSMAYDALRGCMVLFGGIDLNSSGISIYNNETWTWNGLAWTQLSGSGPSARGSQAMVFDSARGLMVLFGGEHIGVNGETWEWNGGWALRDVSGPSSRHQHAMAFDRARGVTVLFGGRLPSQTTGMCSGETYERAATAWSLKATTGPSARSGHAMAYDEARGVTVLFGGLDCGTGERKDDTWEWDGTAWTQRQMFRRPDGRRAHTMVYDAARGVIVLFGGFDYTGSPFGDTWEYDGSAWTPRTGLSNPPMWRGYHAMSYDRARHVSVLFGGGSDDSIPWDNQTWEWDGHAWTSSTAPGPVDCITPAMAYDECRGVTVLFGGLMSGHPSDELWDWNGASWVRQTVPGPAPQYIHAMSFDDARGATVLVGGAVSGSGNLPETWELRSVVSIVAHSISQTACASGTATFAVSGHGPGLLTYRWQWQTIGGAWTDLLEEDNPATDDSGLVIYAWGTATPTVHVRRQGITTFADVSRVNVRCVVSNSCAQAASDAAMLTVCPADFDCDGTVGFGDYEDFVAAFEAGDPEADFTQDGAIDFFDYDEFVVAMEVGC